MRRRKRKPARVYLTAWDLKRMSQALDKLGKIEATDHMSVIRGVLTDTCSDDNAVALGSVFYHAPAESYVIEWNR